MHRTFVANLGRLVDSAIAVEVQGAEWEGPAVAWYTSGGSDGGALTAPSLVGPWHICRHWTEVRLFLVLTPQPIGSPLGLPSPRIPMVLGSPDPSRARSQQRK